MNGVIIAIVFVVIGIFLGFLATKTDYILPHCSNGYAMDMNTPDWYNCRKL